MTNESLEASTLQLLKEMQSCLTEVLRGLAGKEAAGLFENYLFFSSKEVNHIAEGFVLLRSNSFIAASKHLIRPAIEIMFKQQAVLKNPRLLYQIAHSERLEDQKWLAPVWKRHGKDYQMEDQQQWSEFSRMYGLQYPAFPQEEKPLSLFEVAQVSGFEGYYKSYYRMYCQFTHSGFRAMVGKLGFSNSEDNHVLTVCVLSCLDALKEGVKASIPEFDAFSQRVRDFDSQPKE